MEVHKMKMLKYYPVLLLLLSGSFLTGCYTSLATRGYADRYPDKGAYNSNNDNSNSNNDSYSDQDTSYNNDQGDANIDDGPYPYYGRFYSQYYPSVAIGYGVGPFYDPFYYDPFIYDGWCAPYFYSYNPFFYYPYWGTGFGGGFHHGHRWYNGGYRYGARGGYALRNGGLRGNNYGVRGTLTRGTGIYSRNSERSKLVMNNGISTTRNTISRSNAVTRSTIVNNRPNITTQRSQVPNIRNKYNVGRNRQYPIARNNGNRPNSRNNRPQQRTYSNPPQRNSSPGHYNGGSNRSSGSSNRGGSSGRSGGNSRR